MLLLSPGFWGPGPVVMISSSMHEPQGPWGEQKRSSQPSEYAQLSWAPLRAVCGRESFAEGQSPPCHSACPVTRRLVPNQCQFPSHTLPLTQPAWHPAHAHSGPQACRGAPTAHTHGPQPLSHYRRCCCFRSLESSIRFIGRNSSWRCRRWGRRRRPTTGNWTSTGSRVRGSGWTGVCRSEGVNT